MAVDWTQADERVIELAQRIIRENHPRLLDARIGFLFRSEPGSSKGRMVIAQAKKIPASLKAVLDLDFIIWISRPDWLKYMPEQREALIDHELCHCGGSELDGWHIRGHDVEEFVEIIERHGLWQDDLMRTAEAIQEHLPGLEVAREPSGKVVAVRPEHVMDQVNERL